MTPGLWPDEDLIDVRIENKTTVGNVRAVKRGQGRIGTVDNPIGVMGISFTHWILSLRRWILFSGVLWSDLRCDSGPTRTLFRNCARVSLRSNVASVSYFRFPEPPPYWIRSA